MDKISKVCRAAAAAPGRQDSLFELVIGAGQKSSFDEVKRVQSAIAAITSDSIMLPDLFAKPRNGAIDLFDVRGGGYEIRENEIVIDLFCGAGGTSEGVRQAIGESPMFALNHNPIALGVHDANHPDTIHLESDAFAMDPAEHVPPGMSVGLAVFSPSCVHFSAGPAT